MLGPQDCAEWGLRYMSEAGKSDDDAAYDAAGNAASNVADEPTESNHHYDEVWRERECNLGMVNVNFGFS